MKKFLYLSVGLVVFSCSSEISGEGESGLAQDFKVTGFNEIDAQGKFRLRLIPNDSAYVSVQSHQNLIDNIVLTTNGEKLSIDEKEAVSTFEDYSVYVYYNMPIKSIDLDNSVYLESANTVITDALDINVHGHAKVEQFTVSCKELEIEATDMATVELKGSANDLELDLSNNATADLSELIVKIADVELENETEASVNASNEITGKVKDNAILNYIGMPQKNVDVIDLGEMNNK